MHSLQLTKNLFQRPHLCKLTPDIWTHLCTTTSLSLLSFKAVSDEKHALLDHTLNMFEAVKYCMQDLIWGKQCYLNLNIYFATITQQETQIPHYFGNTARGQGCRCVPTNPAYYVFIFNIVLKKTLSRVSYWVPSQLVVLLYIFAAQVNLCSERLRLHF